MKRNPDNGLKSSILLSAIFLGPADVVSRKAVFKKSPCSMSLGRIAFVHMAGEQESYIRDETQTDEIPEDNQYRQQQTVTLYDDTTYRLHVQVDCNGQWARGGNDYACDLSQDVNLWIDFNDQGFNGVENQVSLRPWTGSNTQGGAYDLELRIPAIDGRNTKSGSHRMRISLVPTEKYRRECGVVDLNEVREYTANIVPKIRQAAAYQPAYPTAYPAVYRTAYPEVYRTAYPEVYRTAYPEVYRTAYPAVYRTAYPVVYPGKYNEISFQ